MEEKLMKYARPAEFDNGKVIKILGFHGYTVEQITEIDGKEPPFQPKNPEGKIYRLDFEDQGKQRVLDMYYVSFKNDLSGRIKTAGEVGLLSRTIVGQTPKGGPSYKWVWEPNPVKVEDTNGNIEF